MKNRSICILLMITAFVFILSSCRVGSGMDKNNNSNGSSSGTSGSGDAVDDDKFENIFISVEDFQHDGTSNLINDIMYKVGMVYEPADSPDNADITIGRVDSNASERAYNLLADMTDRFIDYSGYIIYSNGKQLAFAYDSEYAFLEGSEALLSLYDNYSYRTFDKGIVKEDGFYIRDYVDGLREKQYDVAFAALEKELGTDATAKLRNMYSLYGSDMYIWIANLYCPETGGFYYSNSARNNAGYLPDIESTVQILDWLVSTGMVKKYDDDLKLAFSDEIKQKLVSFARGLQDEEDGYFYHPQWGKAITVSRRGRDLTWAIKLFKTFGELPYYDAPGLPGLESQTALSSRLLVGPQNAVSKVVSVSSNLPYYLKSLTAWDLYITSLNIKKDSYSAGNTLDSLSTQIKAAGQEYVDHLINRLDGMQDDLGIWESADRWESSTKNKYDAVNGIMKIVSTYNNFGKQIPNPKAVIQRCIDVTLLKDGDEHICSVYNPWVALSVVVNNVEKYNPDNVKEIREDLVAKSAALVEATLKKMVKYQKPKGGFSFLANSSASTSQGAPIAPPNMPESDVNASTIASTGIISCIFSALGVKKVPIYYEDDADLFFNTINEMGLIIKNEGGTSISSDGTVTFDGYTSENGVEEGGSSLLPANGVENQINDKELNADGDYEWINSVPREDPSPDGENDLALRTEVFTKGCSCGKPSEECTCKKVALNPSSTYFKYASSEEGNRFVFDTDIYFESGLWTIGQMCFNAKKGGSSPVTLTVTALENGKINISGKDENGVSKNVVTGLPMGEWINLRVELYKIYETVTDENAVEQNVLSSVKIKLFVNGIYRGECNGDASKEFDIAYFNYSYYRHFASVVWFDNVKLSRDNEGYISEEAEKETTAIFDNYKENLKPAVNGVVTKPSDLVETLVNDKELDENENYKWIESTVVQDPSSQTEGDLVLKTVTKVADCTCGLTAEECTCKKTASVASATYYKLLETSSEGNCYVFSGDFFFESGLYTIGQINFIQGKGQASSVTLNVTANKDNTVTVSCSGTDFSATVPMGEWVNLKFELYKIYDGNGDFVSNTVKVFIGGKYKTEFTTATNTPIAYIAYFYYRSFESTVYFDNILAEKVDKKYVSDEPVKETVAVFDSYVEERNPAVSGVITKPSEYVNTVVNDKTVGDDGNYSYFSSTVVPSPDSMVEGDLALKSTVTAGAANASATFFRLLQADVGNTYIFDFDVYFESGLWTIGQMYFTPDNKTAWSSISLNVTANQDSTVQIGAVKNIPMKEWVNITIELYKIYTEDGAFKKYIGKIFVNGSYSGEFSGTTDVNINAFCYSYYRSFDSTVYFDNASLIRCDKEYKMTVPVADFENGDTDSTGVVTSPASGVSTKANTTYTTESCVVEDPDENRSGNLVLKTVNKEGLTGSVAASHTAFTVSGSEGNTYVLEMDIRIDNAKWNIARIYFGTDFGSANYIAINDGLNFESVKSVMGLNTWARIRIEVYNIYANGQYSETKVKIFAGEEYKGELSYSAELTPSAFSFRYLNLAGTGSDNEVYFDNVSAYRTDTEYKSEQ